MPAARSRATSRSRFSSWFAITRSGRSSSTRAMDGFFVPPTLGTRAISCAGCTHQSVTPTTRGPSPSSNSASVRLGTSETIRSGTRPTLWASLAFGSLREACETHLEHAVAPARARDRQTAYRARQCEAALEVAHGDEQVVAAEPHVDL